MTGKLIVLEGMDGAGTTTQSGLLVSHLQKRGVRVTRSAEPTKSALGQEARRLLAHPDELDQELLVALALCFAADRMQHVHEVILPSLQRGDFVVLDRYMLSSMVYQGLHLPASFVKEINRYAIKPDLTIVLDVDVNLACQRLMQRGEAKDFYEIPETLHKIKNRYLLFAQQDAQDTLIIEANESVADVEKHILRVVTDRFF